MKTSSIIGISILMLIWMWLAWTLLATSGVTLKNLILLAMTAIIIFVPLFRKLKNPRQK